MRVSKREIPKKPTKCNRESCVYIKDGVCDHPRLNRDNSDAECHKTPPAQVVAEFLLV